MGAKEAEYSIIYWYFKPADQSHYCIYAVKLSYKFEIQSVLLDE